MISTKPHVHKGRKYYQYNKDTLYNPNTKSVIIKIDDDSIKGKFHPASNSLFISDEGISYQYLSANSISYAKHGWERLTIDRSQTAKIFGESKMIKPSTYIGDTYRFNFKR